MSFTEVFGDNVVYPSQLSLLKLTTAIGVTLSWPIELQNNENPAAAIIEVIATAGGVAISFADATEVSTGYTSMFINTGVNTFTVKDTSGNTLASIASGEAWMLYLSDNSTADGTWGLYQQGAGTSSANAAALAGAGLKAILNTLNTKMSPLTKNANYVILDANRARVLQWTGGVGALTLPDPTVVGSDWYVAVKNAGSGTVTVTASAGTLDGGASIQIPTNESTFVYSDGTNMYTVGLGQQVNSVFDFIEIDVTVPGVGDYTLTGAQLNRVAYRFTGVLTGNINIIVPAAVQQYWVDNETTGAFDLTVKTALGTGYTIPQTQRTILYCDGTNVINAETILIVTPVGIAQGGTGAATIAGAQANLQVPPTSRTITAGVGISGGGDLSANRTIALDTANTRNVDHASVSLVAGAGLTGGGDITATRTVDVGAGTGITVNANDVALDTANTRNVDHASVTLTAGAGLTGGGDITASRTLDVGAGTGITVNANDVALDTANTRNVDHAAVSIVTSNSLTGGGDISASRTLSLVNDSASPGNSKYYGTDGGGTKGFFTVPGAVSRTWQDMTGSRALGATYTNSSGQTIQVLISLANSGASASAHIILAGFDFEIAGNATGGALVTPIVFDVPDGATYQLYQAAASIAIGTWLELRP